MGEIIASLDGYFCSPGHNFDWKRAGVSRVVPQRARSHGNGGEGVRQESPAPAMTTARQDLQRRCLPLPANDLGRLAQWLRCGYAHNYWAVGNTTHGPPSDFPAQISYIGEKPDGKLLRIASFHLDYLIDVAQEQVATLTKGRLAKPCAWWIHQT